MEFKKQEPEPVKKPDSIDQVVQQANVKLCPNTECSDYGKLPICNDPIYYKKDCYLEWVDDFTVV